MKDYIRTIDSLTQGKRTQVYEYKKKYIIFCKTLNELLKANNGWDNLPSRKDIIKLVDRDFQNLGYKKISLPSFYRYLKDFKNGVVVKWETKQSGTNPMRVKMVAKGKTKKKSCDPRQYKKITFAEAIAETSKELIKPVEKILSVIKEKDKRIKKGQSKGLKRMIKSRKKKNL